MINAAVELVNKQGYERTTVEQIAEAVDVSPRTVAHYFPSKDRLLLSVLDAYTDAVADELTRVPVEVAPMRALLIANLAALQHAVSQGPSADGYQIVSMLRTIHLSRPLQPLAPAVRSPAMRADVARRLGLDLSDRRVEMIISSWIGVVTVAWSCVDVVNQDPQQVNFESLATVLRDRLLNTFAAFVDMSNELTRTEEPGRVTLRRSLIDN